MSSACCCFHHLHSRASWPERSHLVSVRIIQSHRLNREKSISIYKIEVYLGKVDVLRRYPTSGDHNGSITIYFKFESHDVLNYNAIVSIR